MTWEWLATPNPIGPWEVAVALTLTPTAAGSDQEMHETLTIPFNAYRFEKHCH